jgi:hypothetical protein
VTFVSGGPGKACYQHRSDPGANNSPYLTDFRVKYEPHRSGAVTNSKRVSRINTMSGFFAFIVRHSAGPGRSGRAASPEGIAGGDSSAAGVTAGGLRAERAAPRERCQRSATEPGHALL